MRPHAVLLLYCMVCQTLLSESACVSAGDAKLSNVRYWGSRRGAQNMESAHGYPLKAAVWKVHRMRSRVPRQQPIYQSADCGLRARCTHACVTVQITLCDRNGFHAASVVLEAVAPQLRGSLTPCVSG